MYAVINMLSCDAEYYRALEEVPTEHHLNFELAFQNGELNSRNLQYELVDADNSRKFIVCEIAATDFGLWMVKHVKSPDCKHLRLGQAFLNDNFPSMMHSTLFYERDDQKAAALIYEFYVRG